MLFESECEWELEPDEEVERELRQEAEEQAFHGLHRSDMQRARLLRLEDAYFKEVHTQTFWRLRYNGWIPGSITILECLRRLHALLDHEDEQVRYEAACDIEARLYQGKRMWG